MEDLPVLLEDVELLSFEETSTESSPSQSDPRSFIRSTLDSFGTPWSGYKFVVDPVPIDFRFVDADPLDPVFSHLYLLYQPYYPLLHYPMPNLRSEYLFEQLSHGRNKAGIYYWDFGFVNTLFSRTWRESGVPLVSKYAFRGTIDEKKEFIMAHLFTLMKCSEAQICKVYETARDAGQMEASAEFLESVRELHPNTSGNSASQHQITYVTDRWASLVAFIRDPVIRRFLNNVTVNNFLAKVASKDAAKLVREVDIRYREEFASALVNLQTLFDNNTSSPTSGSEKAPSEIAPHDQVPGVDEVLVEHPAQQTASKASAKKKKKNSRRKKQAADESLLQESQPTTDPSIKETTIVPAKDLPDGTPGTTETFSLLHNTTASNADTVGSLPHDQFTDALSTQQSSMAGIDLDVESTTMDRASSDASVLASSTNEKTGAADFHVSGHTIHSQVDGKKVHVTEKPQFLSLMPTELKPIIVPGSFVTPSISESPLTLAPMELKPIVVPGSFVDPSSSESNVCPPAGKPTQAVVSSTFESPPDCEPGLRAKATTASKKHNKTYHKKDKPKTQQTTKPDSVAKGNNLNAPNHLSVQDSQNTAVTKIQPQEIITSPDVAESSSSSSKIVSKPDHDFNQGLGRWSDEMDVDEALRQFPNLREHTDPRDEYGDADRKEVQTTTDFDSGWTVVKSIPKRVKKAGMEGSSMQKPRKTSPKGLCIGTNYRKPQKASTVQTLTPAPLLTGNMSTTVTRDDISRAQNPQPVVSDAATMPANHQPSIVLPLSDFGITKKKGKISANKQSHGSSLDQISSKSSVVEAKPATVLASNISQPVAATPSETHLPMEMNSKTSPTQASNLTEASVFEPKLSQNAELASHEVDRAPHLSPSGHSSEVLVSQKTTEPNPNSLVGVLVKAGVEVSALSSLITNTSTAMLDSPLMEKPDNKGAQGGSESESTRLASLATEIETNHGNKVRPILPSDSLTNQAIQSPTASSIVQNKTVSSEQVRAASEADVSNRSVISENLQTEELLSKMDISVEQTVVDCGEYQGWVTKPTVILWNGEDGYEVFGDRFPPPLTLADHPELNKFLKPGFFFQCAYCQQEMSGDVHKEKDIVCPGCGPCSGVRYCQESHLLADAIEHHKICGTQSGQFPVLIHMLPDHYKTLYPYIVPINGSITPEGFRQMAYSMIVKRDGEIENPFLAFYKVKMSNKGKKRLAEYKNDTYQFQDSGNYYIFSSAEATKGTATLMTLNIIEGGLLFNRAISALFLTNNSKLARFVYRKVKSDVMLHPDKAFKAEVLLAFDSQFSREFPHFDISKAGYIGHGRLAYDIDVEWNAIKDIVAKYEMSHPILKTWLNPPTKMNESAMKTWGVGWTGQPADEWMNFLNKEYFRDVMSVIMYGMTCKQLEQKMADYDAKTPDTEEEGPTNEGTEGGKQKSEAIEREAELHAEADDQMYEERMRYVQRHLADPAIQEIYRQEDAVKAEREAIARAQYE